MSYPPYGQPDQPPEYNPNAHPPYQQPPYPGQGVPSSPYPQQGGYPPAQQPYPQQPYPQQGGYPPPQQYPQQGGYPPSSPYPQQGGYPPSQPYGQGGGYPPNYQQGGGAPMLPPPQKSNSPLGLILGVVAAVIVVALIGTLFIAGKGGAGPFAALGATATPVGTATPTPLPTVPPAPAGFTTYTASDNSYTIAYPSDWISTPAATAAAFLSSDAQDYFVALDSGAQATPAQYSTFVTSFTKGLGATNVKLSTTLTKVTLGANSWNKETGTMTFQSKAYSIATLGTDHGNSTFFILYFAPTADYQSVESKDFTVMATSLAFKK